MASTGEKIKRVYEGFRGVDFRGGPVNLSRSPDALNVWRVGGDIGITTRPSAVLSEASTSAVYGIFFYKGNKILHCGNFLYEVKGAVWRQIYGNMSHTPSVSFCFKDKIYFLDGKNYLVYDGSALSKVEGFIPTTSISRNPKSGGETLQDANLLTTKRINTFIGDGEGVEFWFDAQNLDSSFAPIVKINDEVVTSGYTIDFEGGKITLETPLEESYGGRDNMSVTFAVIPHELDKGYDTIAKCKMISLFDNRVFFSGNPDFPNRFWHCALYDPTYVGTDDYYDEGLDVSPIRGMVTGNNALWVFREPSDANTTIFYHNPLEDDQYGKVYPKQHSSVSVGCIGKAINFGDDIVFFSESGMEGISGDITTEQVCAHRSSMVDARMTREAGYKDMILVEWRGFLLVIIGRHVYLADRSAIYTFENHNEYEWFYFELDKEVICAAERDGVLYLGCADGVYTMGDTKGDVYSYWTTPKDEFLAPSMLKTTNKRGCVAEAYGDIKAYAKTEKSEFELVGEFSGILDYFVARVKRKKFKDIQLKFESNTRFTLERVTLESYIGGYIKR